MKSNAETFTLTVTYSDNVTITADFKPLLEKGGVMTRLRVPAIFASVSIGPRGRSVVWDEDIDFCADGLRMKYGNDKAFRVAA